jgi:hypothetical protein
MIVLLSNLWEEARILSLLKSLSKIDMNRKISKSNSQPKQGVLLPIIITRIMMK